MNTAIAASVKRNPRRSSRHHAWRSCARAIVALFLLVPVGGCSSIDRALDEIEQTVTAIEAAPGNWGSMANTLIQKLDTYAKDIAHDVQVVVNEVEGQTVSYLYCTTDFFGYRLADGLQALAHSLDSTRPAPTLKPVVCNTSPATSIKAGTDHMATFYGFNFSGYNSQVRFTAEVAYSDGTTAAVQPGGLSITTPYQMTVDLQAVNFTALDRTRGPRLIVKWGNETVSSYGGGQAALPILIPVPKPPALRELQFKVSTHAANGGVPLMPGHCSDLNTTYNLPGGWMVDTSRGDADHPGVSELSNLTRDNKQGRNSLRAYNYQAISATAVKVTGRICGDSGTGPGAIFERTYRVYMIEATG